MWQRMAVAPSVEALAAGGITGRVGKAELRGYLRTAGRIHRPDRSIAGTGARQRVFGTESWQCHLRVPPFRVAKTSKPFEPDARSGEGEDSFPVTAPQIRPKLTAADRSVD